jgi:hypothetical protein
MVTLSARAWLRLGALAVLIAGVPLTPARKRSAKCA